MEKIEMPPGFIRVWKALVLVALTCVAFAASGAYVGHSTARVVEKEVRVEVSTQCTDVMILVDENSKEIHCAHPEQRGHFEDNHTVGGCNIPHTYLVCTCPTPQLSLEAGAK